MDVLIISQLEAADETIEIVEHKGLGHPDTICDALAENLSRNLCREYRSRFGEILHNVDKALLRGGRAMAEVPLRTTRRSASAMPRLARWNDSFSRSKQASMEEIVPASTRPGAKTLRSWVFGMITRSI